MVSLAGQMSVATVIVVLFIGFHGDLETWNNDCVPRPQRREECSGQPASQDGRHKCTSVFFFFPTLFFSLFFFFFGGRNVFNLVE